MTASRTGCASAAARKLKGDESLLFSGEFWTAKRGLELGLVDSLGELRSVLQARYGAKVHLPVIAPRRRLLSRFGLGSGIDVDRALDPRRARGARRTGNDSDCRTADETSHARRIPTTSPPCAPGSTRWPRHCRAIDYEGARPIFADDLIAFGTFTDFMHGRELTEQKQWRNVWGTIRNFRFDLDTVEAIVSADRLTAIGMGVWTVRRLPSQRRPLRPRRPRHRRARPPEDRRSVRRHPHPPVAQSAARPTGATASSAGTSADASAAPRTGWRRTAPSPAACRPARSAPRPARCCAASRACRPEWLANIAPAMPERQDVRGADRHARRRRPGRWSRHRHQLGRGALGVGEVRLADLLADRHDDALPADHGAEAERQRDRELDPQRDVVGERQQLGAQAAAGVAASAPLTAPIFSSLAMPASTQVDVAPQPRARRPVEDRAIE